MTRRSIKTVPTEMARIRFRLKQKPTRTVYRIDCGNLTPDEVHRILVIWQERFRERGSRPIKL